MGKAPVFPKHCVQGTEGVKLIDGLCEAVGGTQNKDDGFACKVSDDNNVLVIQKGTHPSIDSFGGVYDNRFAPGPMRDAIEKEVEALGVPTARKNVIWGSWESAPPGGCWSGLTKNR